MSGSTRRQINGPTGEIECAIDEPDSPACGTVIICHPHPQHGGTLDNKVVQTLTRAFVAIGWRSVRFNFRGVGKSAGVWDGGDGEIDDALAVIAAWRMPDCDDQPAGNFAAAPTAAPLPPLMLAGFSFGAYVAAEAAWRLPDKAKPQRLTLIGPSTQKQRLPVVPANTLVIHGEVDDVVPLSATLDWARPLALPVIVFPGVGHFFHGQLGLLKSVLVQQLSPRQLL